MTPRAVAQLPQGGPSGKGLPLDDSIPGYSTFAKPEDDTSTGEQDAPDESIYRVDGPRDIPKERGRIDVVDQTDAGPSFNGLGKPHDSPKTKYPYRDGIPNSHNAAAQRVLRRFLGKTQNVERLEKLLEAVYEPLRKLDRPWGLPKEADREPNARKLGEAARTLYAEAVFVFEDEARGKSQEKTKHMRRFKNFRKLLKDYAGVRNWEDAEAVIGKHQTKSKRAIEKLAEYGREALAVLRYFDSEVEETLSIENYTVSLVTTGQHGWDDDSVQKLKEVLKRSNQLLSKAGLGAATGGRVLAWPANKLSGAAKGSAGAEASYNISSDVMKVAVGGSLTNVVHAVVHELGHRVYFKTIGGRGRDAWEEFFGDNVKPPDLDAIFRKWDTWRSSEDAYAKSYGDWLAYFASHLKKKGDEETLMWLNLIALKAGIDESFTPMSGEPKKGTVSGYEQLKAKAAEVKVFIHPVSAYSGKDAHELFAETLAYLLVYGPGKVPEIVRDAFGRAVPALKTAESAEFVAGLYRLQDAPEMRLTAGAKVAATVGMMTNGLNPVTVVKSQQCKADIKRADMKNLRWIFSVNCGNGAKVVRFKADRKGNVTKFMMMDFHVACSCPAWRWQGPEFHSTSNDFQDPKTKLQGTASPPDIRDPERVNKVCKHVAAVLTFTKTWVIPKAKKKK